jgi:mannose-1-phosphate guanylyltransferase
VKRAALILAGGNGETALAASANRNGPKQFITLTQKPVILQIDVQRVTSLFHPSLFINTEASSSAWCRTDPEIPIHVILEQCGRHGNGIALSLLFHQQEYVR